MVPYNKKDNLESLKELIDCLPQKKTKKKKQNYNKENKKKGNFNQDLEKATQVMKEKIDEKKKIQELKKEAWTNKTKLQTLIEKIKRIKEVSGIASFRAKKIWRFLEIQP